MLQKLGGGLAIACPAFPENGRSVYKGHLFVGDQLLSESGLQHHPLTPMTDANLVRVLGRQAQGGVGLVEYGVVDRGAEAIERRFAELLDEGKRLAVVDALDDEKTKCNKDAVVHEPDSCSAPIMGAQQRGGR